MYLRICRLRRDLLKLGSDADEGRIRKRIDKYLREYPVPTHWQRFEMRTWEAGPDGQAVEKAGHIFETVTSDESRLVDAVLQLSQRGLLNRVRHCERGRCSWWFYQRFRHQHFCSEQCELNRRRSKAFKAKHAEAQKENDRRQQELSRRAYTLRRRLAR